MVLLFKAMASILGKPCSRYSLGLWCSTQLSTIFQLYRAVSFIGEGNRNRVHLA